MPEISAQSRRETCCLGALCRWFPRERVVISSGGSIASVAAGMCAFSQGSYSAGVLFLYPSPKIPLDLLPRQSATCRYPTQQWWVNPLLSLICLHDQGYRLSLSDSVVWSATNR